MTDNEKGNTAVGVIGILTVAFITLRLVGITRWPWLWVLCPLWLPIAFYTAFALVFLILGVVYNLKDNDK
jgi:hypothetical protein